MEDMKYIGEPSGPQQSTIKIFASDNADLLQCYRLSSLTIWSTTKEGFLCGVQVGYTHLKDSSRTLVSPPIKGSAQDSVAISLNFEESEQIILIEGYYNNENVTRFCVLTNHGRYIESGDKAGNKFTWKFSPEQYFCGLQVCVEVYVTYLLALWVDRPPQVVSKTIKEVDIPNTYKPSMLFAQGRYNI
eukprot:TRINITY_DN2072_c0_g1_i5.p2 TRINITY_DN2072_c0_g1~~TRINITY_DN2072_c0_g1_i5.p2  ORF type:complete len:188 (-),score=40.32 TRINITY_DN2072_c0_g1_i5:1382-1945(-)